MHPSISQVQVARHQTRDQRFHKFSALSESACDPLWYGLYCLAGPSSLPLPPRREPSHGGFTHRALTRKRATRGVTSDAGAMPCEARSPQTRADCLGRPLLAPLLAPLLLPVSMTGFASAPTGLRNSHVAAWLAKSLAAGWRTRFYLVRSRFSASCTSTSE